MTCKLEVVKNTLPYFQPYSIILIDLSTNEKFVLGDYKNIDKANIAMKLFQSKTTLGSQYLKETSKRKLGSNAKLIEQLEKRIGDPNGDDHEVKSKNLKRKIVLD